MYSIKINKINKKVEKLSLNPGVYVFYDKNKNIIYIGKATNLKNRVGSYFKNMKMNIKNIDIRIRTNRPIEMMIQEVFDIKTQETESVLEALILEANLIKKHKPKYNVLGKDDKSYSYFAITKEDFPRVLIARKKDLEKISNSKFQISKGNVYGPYVSKKQMQIALKILQKIFPFHATSQKSEKGCLDFQIGKCPGPYIGAISKQDYAKNIYSIKMILEGKKKNLLKKMKKEMQICAKLEKFEEANEIKKKIFALQHIQDVAFISQEKNNIFFPELDFKKNKKFQVQEGNIIAKRIEGYDISNISGRHNVASMVVFDNSEGNINPNKSQYRKFKIKIVKGINDVGAMEEVLMRRFKNNWPKPNLIVLDGGQGHLNIALKVLRNYQMEIPLLAVAKGHDRKKLDIRTFGNVPKISKELIRKIRDEAHRFAISYHKKIRDKKF